jgi:hypothetical protein
MVPSRKRTGTFKPERSKALERIMENVHGKVTTTLEKKIPIKLFYLQAISSTRLYYVNNIPKSTNLIEAD